MDNYSVEQVEAISLPLVNRFYKSCRYSAKAGRGERVFVLREEQQILAALRLVPKPEGFYFLRSMCVHPDYRGQGLGSRLLLGLISVLDQNPCFCYPFSHLEAFYGQIGFTRREPKSLAAFIREPYQRYCDQGRDIVVMVRESLVADT